MEKNLQTLTQMIEKSYRRGPNISSDVIFDLDSAYQTMQDLTQEMKVLMNSNAKSCFCEKVLFLLHPDYKDNLELMSWILPILGKFVRTRDELEFAKWLLEGYFGPGIAAGFTRYNRKGVMVKPFGQRLKSGRLTVHAALLYFEYSRWEEAQK